MINPNLEVNLKEYCITLDSNLFEEKLYLPLKYLATSICQRKKLPKREFEDGMVDDMVSHCSIKLPEYYNAKKGYAKAAAYILMNQYLLQRIQFNSKQKRDCKKTIYLEDIKNPDRVIEIEIDDIHEMKEYLMENKQHIFDKINNKFHKKLAKTIIDAIEHPDNYEINRDSLTSAIAIKCNTNLQNVYLAMKLIKKELLFSN